MSKNPAECFVSVDVETAGPVPGRHALLSVGACVAGRKNERFYAELRPEGAAIVPEAVAVTGLNLDDLARTGEEPRAAFERFRDWAVTAAGGGPLVFVGFNAGFDWSFVNWHFHTYMGENPFGFAPLDIKSFYMGFAGCSWGETMSSRMPAEFRVEPDKRHNALADAVAQAEVFERLLTSAEGRR